MNQLAHERMRYAQLANSFSELQRSHAELHANLEDYQELIGAMEVQCEESEGQKVRLEVELQEARQEISQLQHELDNVALLKGNPI